MKNDLKLGRNVTFNEDTVLKATRYVNISDSEAAMNEIFESNHGIKMEDTGDNNNINDANDADDAENNNHGIKREDTGDNKEIDDAESGTGNITDIQHAGVCHYLQVRAKSVRQ